MNDAFAQQLLNQIVQAIALEVGRTIKEDVAKMLDERKPVELTQEMLDPFFAHFIDASPVFSDAVTDAIESAINDIDIDSRVESAIADADLVSESEVDHRIEMAIDDIDLDDKISDAIDEILPRLKIERT